MIVGSERAVQPCPHCESKNAGSPVCLYQRLQT